MRKLSNVLLGGAFLAAATVTSTAAFAAKIGISMDKFDDNFLTILRNGMIDYGKTIPDLTVQVEDAKDDVSKQLSQIQNFIANGVDAIIVNPVDASATVAMTKLAADAGVPLVYVNRQPADVDALGPKAAFVGSDELDPAPSRERKSAGSSTERAIFWSFKAGCRRRRRFCVRRTFMTRLRPIHARA